MIFVVNSINISLIVWFPIEKPGRVINRRTIVSFSGMYHSKGFVSLIMNSYQAYKTRKTTTMNRFPLWEFTISHGFYSGAISNDFNTAINYLIINIPKKKSLTVVGLNETLKLKSDYRWHAEKRIFFLKLKSIPENTKNKTKKINGR